MKYFCFIIVLISLFSCKSEKEEAFELFTKEVEKVKIWSYPARGLWDVEDGKERQGIKILNNKIQLDTTKIIENVELNGNQKENLFELLNEDVCFFGGTHAACYIPRHLILFYDENEKLIGFYEFCIECGGSVESKSLKNIPTFCIEKGTKMEQLLKGFGLKITSDKSLEIKQVEKELGKKLLGK
jgi:hypothetical protein